MPGLTKNTRRASVYKQGGISVALGWDTTTPAGIAQASVDNTGAFTLATGATVTRHEFEENTCMFSDNTTIGTNRYPKHMLGFKFAGRNAGLTDLAVTLDLKRTSWAIRTFTGEYLVLGMKNGLISEKGESGAGATTDDFNGFDYVISGGETTKAVLITEAEFNALTARVVAD